MTTDIEWAEIVWNFTKGCKEKSAGCLNCYARAWAWRHQHNPKIRHLYAGTVRKLANGTLQWTGKVIYDEHALSLPLRVKKPSRFFTDSMSDLWYEEIPFHQVTRCLAMMCHAPQHQYITLTKRIDRALEYFRWLTDSGSHRNAREKLQIASTDFRLDYDKAVFPIKNLWVIASVEDQKEADNRCGDLIQIKREGHAHTIGLSVEPMLEEIDIREYMSASWNFDWVVCGAESGPGARPFQVAWAHHLHKQCQAYGIPFFMKQICVRGKKIAYDQFPPELQVREYPVTQKEGVCPSQS